MTAVQPRPDERSPLEVFDSWVDRRFPGIEGRLAKLRRWLRDILADHPCRDDAVLVASELAGNAIAHTRSGADLGAYHLVVHIGPHLVRVEIHDAGGTDTEPDVTPPDENGHGYGLQLVEGLAHRWGTEGDTRDGRCVWAELHADDSPPGLSAARPGPAG